MSATAVSTDGQAGRSGGSDPSGGSDCSLARRPRQGRAGRQKCMGENRLESTDTRRRWALVVSTKTVSWQWQGEQYLQSRPGVAAEGLPPPRHQALAPRGRANSRRAGQARADTAPPQTSWETHCAALQGPRRSARASDTFVTISDSSTRMHKI